MASPESERQEVWEQLMRDIAKLVPDARAVLAEAKARGITKRNRTGKKK